MIGLAVFGAIALLVLVLIVVVVVAAAIFFWPQIRLLWRLLQALPDLAPALRLGATGLRLASGFSAQTGRVACAAGQVLDQAATTIGSFGVPTLSVQTTSLGSALRSNTFFSGLPVGALDGFQVITSVTPGTASVFGASANTVSGAAGRLKESAGVLGYQCSGAIDWSTDPPAPPDLSVGGALETAADGLDNAAALLEQLQS